MTEEQAYRPYPVGIKVMRSTKGIYSWEITCRSEADESRAWREQADEEAFDRAVALDERLSRKFEVKDAVSDQEA